MTNPIYTVEFDNYAIPRKVGSLQIIEDEDEPNSKLVVNTGDKAVVVLDAYRDQWGVYLTIGGITIAQEDNTRSFLDGLIKCLQKIKDRNEFETKSATIIEPLV
jgi:hypothetical protein